MALKNISGQEKALEILRGSVIKNRIAHAYLFIGEDGIGKRLTAINFAKALNCLQNTDKKNQGSEPGGLESGIDCCDECSSCVKIDKAVHPDAFFLTPEDGRIKVGEIRKLGESLSYKAFEGNWKIAIIDKAHTMNQSAANAFLKTLEEPPGKSLLILISSLPELIPTTIQSRCQKISFSPLPLEKMQDLLKHKYASEGSKITSKQAILLSLLSGGRPGWALSKDLIEKRDRSFDKFKVLLRRVEENLWEDRDSMEEWFDWVQLWLRDIAVIKATGREDLLINQDREEEIINISKKAGLKDILKLSDIFYNIKYLLRFNLNKQLTLYYTYLLLKKTFGMTRL